MVTVEQLRCRPTVRVPEAAEFLGVSARVLYDQLAPGEPLAHMTVRVGRRVLIKTSALLDLVGAGQ